MFWALAPDILNAPWLETGDSTYPVLAVLVGSMYPQGPQEPMEK